LTGYLTAILTEISFQVSVDHLEKLDGKQTPGNNKIKIFINNAQNQVMFDCKYRHEQKIQLYI